MRKVLRSILLRNAARQLARLSPRASDRLQNVPVTGQFRVRIAPGTSFRYLAAPSDAVGRALYWGELLGWEAETWGSFIP